MAWTRTGLACCVLIAWSGAIASAAPQGQPAKPQAPPPKQPAPIFLRHHRGIYKNAQGFEVVDATPQAPPLDTDDPGVPDKGEYEINLTTRAQFLEQARRVDLLFVDANYGIEPSVAGHKLPAQLKFEFPLAAARTAGEPYAVGIGEAAAGVKFNLYSSTHDSVAVSVYPQIAFGFSGSVDKGLSDPGQTLILPILVFREFPLFAVSFNAGIEKPLNDSDRETSSIFSVGVGRPVTRRWALMADIVTEAALNQRDDRATLFNVGVIRGLRRVVVYGRVGHTLFAEEGLSETRIGVGVKIVR